MQARARALEGARLRHPEFAVVTRDPTRLESRPEDDEARVRQVLGGGGRSPLSPKITTHTR
jgi:hypothetical protein